MQAIEEEFGDLRNWQAEVNLLCSSFRAANGQDAEVLLLNPVTYALMRQLAAQSRNLDSWIPPLEEVFGDGRRRLRLGPEKFVDLVFTDAIALSSFQVGISVLVHS